MIKSSRLTLYASIAITIFIVLISIIFYSLALREIKQEVLADLDQQLFSHKHAFNEKLQELTNDILFLKRVPPIQGIIRSTQNNGIDPLDGSTLDLWLTRLETIFESYLESTEAAYQVRYIGLANDGLELVRAEQTISGIEIIHKNQLQKKGNRNYFNDITTLKINSIYFSDITLNRENGAIEIPYNPTLRVAITVNAQDSTLFGFVIINMAMRPFFRSLQDNLRPGYQLYIVNDSGDFLHHPIEKLAFKFEYDAPYRWTDEFQAGDAPSEVLTANNPKFHSLVSQTEIPLMAGHNSLSFAITYPISRIKEEAFWKTIRSLTGVLAGILIIFVYYLLFRRTLNQKNLLTKERARSAAILDGSQDAIIGFSEDGRISEWNQGASSLFGFVKDEVIGINIFSLFPSLGLENGLEQLAHLKQKGELKPLESFVLSKKEENIDVSISFSLVRDETSLKSYFSAIVRDISSQKQAEKKIHEMNQTLEQKIKERTAELSTKNAFQSAILQNAASGIIATNTEGVITHFNPAAELMLGYSAEEMIGRQTPAVFHLESEVVKRADEFTEEIGIDIKPGFEVFICKTKAGLKNVHEWTYVRKDGTTFPVKLSVTDLSNDDNEVIGYLGIATDISEQVRSRKEIEVIKEQLTQAADVAQLGIWTWYPEKDLLLWNEQMIEIYGLSNDSQVNLAAWEALLAPNDRERVLDLFNAALEGHAAFETTFEVITPQGSHKTIKVGSLVERDDQGLPKVVLGINVDITEQINYEASLQKAKDAADLANKTKSEFVANMSHEIRTPMNAITGLLHLIKETDLTHKQRDFINKTDAAAKSLLRILNDILDFSKVEAGKLEIDPHPFRILDMMENITPILAANIGNKNIELIVDVDFHLPAFINLDSLRLQQIIINLAGNAIKFTEQGYVKLQLAKKIIDDEDWLECSIKDTGIGIKAEHISKLFNDFSQAEASTVREFGGTGLGLAISKKLVEMMGGTIEVESEPTKGSKFTVMIPISDCSDIDTLKTQYDFKHLNVLIVDDHHEASAAMKKVVAGLGWSALSVSSGPEAIQQVKVNALGHFDLILMDYDMPGMNGWDASKKIHTLLGDNTATKILMVTAYGREIELPEDEKRQVIQGVLDKPMGASELVNYAFKLFSDQTHETQQATSKTVRIEGMKILLVDDNDINRLVAGAMLEAEGAQVEYAVDGINAIRLLSVKNTRFDLILMDIQMPGIDGYETTRRIQQMPRVKSIPIIAMTANVMEQDKQAAIDAGMAGHIAKPIVLDDMVATIVRCMHDKNSHQRTTPSRTTDGEHNRHADDQDNYLDKERLNTKLAMMRLGNNKQIYLKSVQLFLKNAPGMLSQISSIWPEDTAESARAPHTLKSIAGAVGAVRVAEICKILEHALRKGERYEGYQRDVTVLHEELCIAVDALKKVEQELSYTEGSNGDNNLDIVKKLTLLKEYLAESNMRASEVITQIKRSMDKASFSRYQQLEGLILSLDYEEAEIECESILNTAKAENGTI